ncbi:MAG: transcriptional repressor LexA [Anaerolineaceae bacterium]|nr:transcriptional repressor LexA [Anaerolineaceae bacterium]
MGYQKGEELLQKAVEFIIEFQRNMGYPPNVRDVRKGVGVKSPSHAQKILAELERRDCIAREENKSRTIRILDAAYEFIGMLPLRIEESIMIPIRGKIVAGKPIQIPESGSAIYDYESQVSVLRSAFSPREDINALYALEVRGDSMVDSMINDGDTVIMRKAQEATNGDMVAVWLDDVEETTLKHFYMKDGRIILRPANPTMKDIEVENPEQLEIQGKVIMVIRQY